MLFRSLHGDLSHFLANLATGLLFAAFVQPQLGSGLAWFGIVLSGMLGNFANAWFYRSEPHFSIGASTAVFGALGLLVAGEFIDRLRHAATRAKWQLVLPLGAGLALLAYLGAGDEHSKRTDSMAHLFGFAAGLALGAPAAVFRLREHTPRWLQYIAGWLALAVLAGAWLAAVRRS